MIEFKCYPAQCFAMCKAQLSACYNLVEPNIKLNHKNRSLDVECLCGAGDAAQFVE